MSKAMQRALGVQLGLEDGDATPELSEAASENAAISEGAVEVADATDEVVADDQAATELSEAHEKLEEVSEAIAEASENGGISKEAAVFAHLAIKNACGRFYGPAFAAAVPSVESFSGDSGRRRNTQIALEGIGQMLKSFWEAIKKQIKKLWASVKNWYLRVLDQAPRLKAKVNKLAAAAGGMTGTPESKDFDLGGLHTLNIDGKAPTTSDAVSKFGELAKAAEGLLGDKTSGFYENVLEKFEEVAEKVVDFDLKASQKAGIANAAAGGHDPADAIAAQFKVDFAKIGSEIDDFCAKGGRAIGISLKKPTGDADRFGDDLSYEISDQLFGGSAIVSIFPKNKDQDLIRQARRSGFRFASYKIKPKDVDSSGTFKTLSGADVRRICEEISDICDSIITYKKSWENRDKQQQGIERVGNKIIATAEKDKDEQPAKVKLIRGMVLGMTGFWQNGTGFDTAFTNYLLKVSHATVTWVERSIAQYK